MIKHLLLIGFLLLTSLSSQAHHVLGRPSYNLSEDSTTPPSVQMEAQIGEMSVTFMSFPAFPKANQESRLNLYVTSMKDATTYQGEVEFSVRDDSWFSADAEVIGKQTIDDNVYRQAVIFKEDGNYIIRASFHHNGEPYDIDFPLRVGAAGVIGPIGTTVFIIVAILIGVNFANRKRMQRLQIRRHHSQAIEKS